MQRRGLPSLLAIVAALLLPTPAGAATYTLPAASVDVTLTNDGGLLVRESVTYDFSAAAHGAWLDVPLDGSTISHVLVSEGGHPYSDGAPTELGSSAPDGTYGTAVVNGAERIVWHLTANAGPRTFQIAYQLTQRVIAHDDVVDARLEVWGPGWTVDLASLAVTVHLPEGSPDTVSGWLEAPAVITPLPANGPSATITASRSVAGTTTVLRFTAPRSVLETTHDAIVVHDQVAAAIAAEEASTIVPGTGDSPSITVDPGTEFAPGFGDPSGDSSFPTGIFFLAIPLVAVLAIIGAIKGGGQRRIGNQTTSDTFPPTQGFPPSTHSSPPSGGGGSGGDGGGGSGGDGGGGGGGGGAW